MITARIKNFHEYWAHLDTNITAYQRIKSMEKELYAANRYNKEFILKGFSYPAQKVVDFAVKLLPDSMGIDWKGSIVCPATDLNNRCRAVAQFLDFELNPRRNSKIYLAEQLTPLYNYLLKKYPALIGSEYLGHEITPGFVNASGIRHEDLTQLSFGEGELDFYVCGERFCYTPCHMAAFAESYRVLKNNGMLLWSVPFIPHRYENTMRARITNEGEVVHILEPVLFSDPIGGENNALCYTEFGWEMLDQVRQAGFRNVYGITFWSDSLGYYDSGQFLFCAVK
jgi:hypothetical protein